MAGIYSQGGSAGHRYAGWLSEVEANNFQFGGKVFNGSPSAIYVGSNLVWLGLSYAAKQAILGAFGQTDGKAVIKATNAYLNQLAASDRDKATALAGFINEDPMMVCSLGLEVEGVTMPKRYLWNETTAYIDLTTPINQDLSVEAEGYLHQYANDQGSLFSAGSNGSSGFHIWANGWKYGRHATWTYGAQADGAMQNMTLQVPFKVRTEKPKITYTLSDGSVFYTKTLNNSTFSYNTKLRLFGLNYNGTLYTECSLLGGMEHVKVWNGDTLAFELYSITRNGVCGFVDILTNTFYPNANSSGSFTIEYTLPDGTPWTPSTP